MITLQTERLLLYALTTEQLAMALNQPHKLAELLGIHIVPEVFSEESRQAVMIKMARMSHIEPNLHPWYTYFLIVNVEDREALGVCGFKGTPTLAGSAEVGYAMHPDFRNHGYMTETVRALVKWAFEQESCRRVTAETLRDNLASQRVLQKVGLVLDRAGENMFYWKIDKQPVPVAKPDNTE
ncbi:MAG: GNAT family N-acetyltransferase [Anaerolineaceae bacterium]|nr:GNAT family N-acetyltransferase [Anaerolineaceae bacterium]